MEMTCGSSHGEGRDKLTSALYLSSSPLLRFQAHPGFFVCSSHRSPAWVLLALQVSASLPELLQESLYRLLKLTNIFSPESSICMPPNLACDYLLIVLTNDCQVCEFCHPQSQRVPEGSLHFPGLLLSPGLPLCITWHWTLGYYWH